MRTRGLVIAVVLLLSAMPAVRAQNAGVGSAGGSAGATGGAMGIPGAAGPVKPTEAGANPDAPTVTFNSNKRGQASEGDGAMGCAQETQPSGMSTDPHGVGSRC